MKKGSSKKDFKMRAKLNRKPFSFFSVRKNCANIKG